MLVNRGAAFHTRLLGLILLLMWLAACAPGGTQTGAAVEPQPAGSTAETPAGLPPAAEPHPMFAGEPVPEDWPTYTNTELGYSLRYPPDWEVDEYGMTQSTKEVIFSAPDVQDFQTTLTIARDERTLEQIQQVYLENVTDAVRTDTVFAGGPALQYSYPSSRIEIYVQHAGTVFVILTDEAEKAAVRQSIGSFQFTE